MSQEVIIDRNENAVDREAEPAIDKNTDQWSAPWSRGFRSPNNASSHHETQVIVMVATNSSLYPIVRSPQDVSVEPIVIQQFLAQLTRPAPGADDFDDKGWEEAWRQFRSDDDAK